MITTIPLADRHKAKKTSYGSSCFKAWLKSFKIQNSSRLAYDLVFDVEGTLIKIEVKYAWFDQPSSNYMVHNRRTKTNSKSCLQKIRL